MAEAKWPEKIQARQRGEEICDEEGRKRAIAKLHRPKLKRLYLPNRYVGAAYDPCFYDGAEVELSQRIGGARTAHLDHNFGTLSPGKKADIIMLAADRINVFPLNNVPDTVVTLMDTTNVDTVFVAGRVVKWSSLTSAGCAD